MHLARHSLTATTPTQILDARFDNDCKIFTASTPTGYTVYSTWPLRLLRKRELVNGTLAMVLPLHTTSLLFLLGGGRSPLYPPNKVIVWDDALGREVAELEFRERVRGMVCRRGWLIVALRRRVVAFQFGEQIQRWKEWDTCDNQRGLLALASAPLATLLAIPGLQTGHVHFIHLPPCAPPPVNPLKPTPRPTPHSHTKHPKEMIIAHESALTTLSVPPSGRLLATTSSRGTLIRIWDTHTGNLAREFRRGTDRAVIYGVAFKRDESEICVWSDKGTIHVFRLGVNDGAGNRQSALAPLSPFFRLHKYFDSEWSYAHFRLPSPSSHISLSPSPSITAPKDETIEDERCTVCWIEVPFPEHSSEPNRVEHQLVALTYSGGWYRLALPSAMSPSSNTTHPPSTILTPSVAPSMSSSLPPTTGSPRSYPSPLPRGPGSQVKPSSASSGYGISTSPRDKGKGRDTDKDKDEARDGGRRCTLVEFRKFGRWDGW
ncbi:WD40-repeat-containing domain protein [Gautieria morchelliformis]|nr:WD40-repeat-containing domain protein [Gautieria morchelliformis]